MMAGMTELEIALDRLDRIRDQLRIAEEGVNIDGVLYMNLTEILDDNGSIDYPYDRTKMTEEQKEYEREAGE